MEDLKVDFEAKGHHEFNVPVEYADKVKKAIKDGEVKDSNDLYDFMMKIDEEAAERVIDSWQDMTTEEGSVQAYFKDPDEDGSVSA